MKITGVELAAGDTSAFTFQLTNVPQSDKYFVRAVVGLDADEIIHKFHTFGASSKKKFFNFTLPDRTVILRIGLNPNYSVNETFSDIRDDLYRAISANRSGMVDLYLLSAGGIAAVISGFFTKFEVPHTSETPEVQITIYCDNPILRAINPMVLDDTTLASSNPVNISDNLSTAPHGLVMEVAFTATTSQFTVQDVETDPEWVFEVTPSGGFLSGDILYLSSEYGNKKLYMDRSSTITPLMDRITPNSIWPIIFPKSNGFHFPEIANFDWVNVTHYPAYWGV